MSSLNSNVGSHIESFPNELKLKIFDYLSLKDLFSLTMTSKSLRSTVERSSKLMEKFNVRISKILSSNCVSDRNYPNVTLDIDITEPQVGIIRASFANVRKCMRKLTLDGRISRNFSIPKGFCELCESVEILTINSKEQEGDDIPQLNPHQDLRPYFPSLRKLNVHTDLYIENVPILPQVNWAFMHDGVMFTFERPFESTPNVERITICKQALPLMFYDTCWIADLRHLQNLQVLILKDCGVGVSFNFDHLFVLMLCNCTFFTNEDATFIPTSCEIDWLHIEDCKECFLWIPKMMESDCKVKHFRLANVELPEKCEEIVDKFVERCESYIIKDLAYVQ